MTDRPPLPPFDEATAAQKARLAEDARNSCDPERVALAYTPDSRWSSQSLRWKKWSLMVSSFF